MDDTERKSRFEYRMERKKLPEIQKKGILRARIGQLKLRRAMRLDRKIKDGTLKRSECLTSQHRWKTVLHWFKLKKSKWTAR